MASGNSRKANRGGQRGKQTPPTPNAPQTPQTPQTTTQTLTLRNGDKVEFNGDLTYGNDDAALTDTVRPMIEAWEKKREKAKVEYAYSVDMNGNEVGEKRGGKNSVSTPLRYHQFGATFSHIHPRDPITESNVLGGTFSSQDIKTFTTTKEQTCRAAAKEGTYSITKLRGGKFDGKGLRNYIYSEEAKAQKKLNAERVKLQKSVQAARHDYKTGAINKQAYDTKVAKCQDDFTKAFNTFLVDMHQSLLQGQSTYGYTYTLERRK